MAGKGDIKAGSAYVELLLKNNAFTKGLNAAGKQLKDFGAATTAMGAGIGAAGATIVGGLAAAVTQFAAVGSALNDMSARTGKSGSELAALGYAADMTGGSMEDVEKAILKMAKNGDTRTFDQVAADLAAIEDPAERAAAAFEAWGKSGVKLLPMAESLQELKQAAADKGLIPTDAAIASADALGDALDDVKKSVGAVVFEIGASLAGEVTAAAKAITRIIGTAVKWVRENQAIVKTVAAVGLGLMAAGAAIVAVGTAIAGVGFIFTGIAAAIGALGSVLAVVLSPLGLITAALIAGAVVWAKYTESGQAAVAGVMGFLGELAATFMQTFGGIADAIKAGDLALAGQIAMAGLKVALLQGVAAVAGAVGGAFGDFLGTIGQQIVGGDLAGAWDTTVIGMQALWAGFAESMVAVFTTAARAIIDVWQKATTAIAQGILAVSAQGGALGGLASSVLGVDMSEEQKRADKLAAGFAKTQYGQGGAKKTDVLGDAQGAAAGILGGQADAWRAKLDKMDRDAQARTAAANAKFAGRTQGGASGASDAADKAQQELDALTKQAGAAAAAAKAGDAAARKPAMDIAGEGGGEVKSVGGTFSAAAALAMGGQGGGPQERTAKACEQQNEWLKQIAMENARQTAAIKEEGAIRP